MRFSIILQILLGACMAKDVESQGCKHFTDSLLMFIRRGLEEIFGGNNTPELDADVVNKLLKLESLMILAEHEQLQAMWTNTAEKKEQLSSGYQFEKQLFALSQEINDITTDNLELSKRLDISTIENLGENILGSTSKTS